MVACVSSRDQGGAGRACANCTIQLDSIGTIGNDTANALPSMPIAYAADSIGRIYLSFWGFPLHVYERSGRLLATVGVKGRGPGEFANIGSATIGAGDTLFITDFGLGRVSVFDPKRRFVRSVTLPSMLSLGSAYLNDGKIVVAALKGSPRGFRPLHIVDTGLDSVQAVGESVSMSHSAVDRMRFSVAADRVGGFWAAHPFELLVEHYDARGSVDTLPIVVPDWFRRVDSVVSVSPTVPPQSTITGIATDAHNNIWLTIWRGRRNWRDNLGDAYRSENGRTFYKSKDEWGFQYFETVILVVDPKTGTVLAELAYPGTMYALGNSLLIALESTDVGFQCRIFRAVLKPSAE